MLEQVVKDNEPMRFNVNGFAGYKKSLCINKNNCSLLAYCLSKNKKKLFLIIIRILENIIKYINNLPMSASENFTI